ncbi:hypothetical protein [Rhodoblastus sp.]|uniref:hypothetical protein n=1 Tax=Rhodoblastus sp. TaxID=1962975 RepID=UPI003F959EC2
MKKLLCGALLLAFILPVQGHAMSYFTGQSASTNAANASRTAAAVACIIADGASVALSVEDAVNQGKANQLVHSGTTTTVQAASLDVCQQMGGIAQTLSSPASSN